MNIQLKRRWEAPRLRHVGNVGQILQASGRGKVTLGPDVDAKRRAIKK